MNKDELDNKIVIYQTEDGRTQLDVKLENETVWLTQAQMTELFQTTKQNISLHINNIFKERELDSKATVKEYLTVQHEGKRTVRRKVKYYDLDVIILVGYRVKSIRGTRFRQWATSVLRDYLIKGYAINQRIREENYQQMVQLVRSMARTVKLQDLSKEVRNALLDVVVDYTFALDRLDDYDYQRLSIPESSTEEKFHATYEGAMKVLAELREKFGGSGLFANEKDDSFKSSIGQIGERPALDTGQFPDVGMDLTLHQLLLGLCPPFILVVRYRPSDLICGLGLLQAHLPVLDDDGFQAPGEGIPLCHIAIIRLDLSNTCLNVTASDSDGLGTAMIERQYAVAFFRLPNLIVEFACDVHQLSLGCKTVPEHPSDVFLLVLVDNPVECGIEPAIVVMVRQQPPFFGYPRCEDVYVVVLRVMVKVDEVRLTAHAVFTHHGVGYPDQLLFVLLLSLAGKGKMQLPLC